MAYRLYDMHCHLDFMQDAACVAKDAQEAGLAFFANTVTPAGYLATRAVLDGRANVRLGVGAHPWWVADGRVNQEELHRMLDLIQTTRYVGEVGLDFSSRHVSLDSFQTQRQAFREIARACAGASDRVLSIHSAKAADDVLTILEDTGCIESCRCIFHWFSGSTPQLWRAIHDNCWFSVGESFLRVRHAREYLKLIPRDRLLLETDAPPGEDVPYTAEQIIASLERASSQIATFWDCDIKCAQARLARNSEQLLG